MQNTFLNSLGILLLVISIALLIYFLYQSARAPKKNWLLVAFLILGLIWNGWILYTLVAERWFSDGNSPTCSGGGPKGGSGSPDKKDSSSDDMLNNNIVNEVSPITPLPMHELNDFPTERCSISTNNVWKEGKEQKKYLTTLTNQIQSPEFIQRYTESIRCSLTNKKKFYNQRLIEARSKSLVKKDRNNLEKLFTREDEAQKLLKIMIAELEDVIECIDTRLTNLSSIRVKKDLEDIVTNVQSGFPRLREREDVKELLALQILTFSNSPYLFANSYQNIVLYGKPGVGKTTCAKVISYVYLKSGMLARNRFVEATKSDINSSYVDDTSINMRKLLLRHLEGIVFLDEAYEITPKTLDLGVSHGTQAITELCYFLSSWEGKLVFIAGGYKEEMHRFLGVNQGMDRRFPHKLFLGDYTATALCQIFGRNVPKEVPLNVTLLASLIEFGVQNHAFPNQAGDIGNIAVAYSTLFYADREEKVDNHLFIAFRDYYRQTIRKDISLTNKIN